MRRRMRQNGTGRSGWKLLMRSHAEAPCCAKCDIRRPSTALSRSKALAKLAALSGGLPRLDAHA
eukprot:7573608-Pyramimonas_sp.AAC.1